MSTDQYIFPASFAQQRLWFLDQMVPGTAFYNMSKATRFPYYIDISILRKSLNEIVRRHESLRTTFKAVDGQPFQVISASLEIDLPVHDLNKMDTIKREVAARELAHADALRPFDLANGPLIRFSLIRINPNDHVFLLAMHHIISDAWSVVIFFRELSTLYDSFLQQKSSPLPELPLQYADYAVWQQEMLQNIHLEQQVDYWKKQLQDLTPLQLPLDKKRPVLQTFGGDHQNIEIGPELTLLIKRLSQQENVTVFMTMLATFIALLHRYTNQNDIVLGVPMAGRNQVEIENLIGFFINSVIIRSRISPGMSFLQLLHQVKNISLEAFAHGDLPFEKLVEELHPQRDLSRNPLFQVLFQMAAAREGLVSQQANDGMDVKVNTSKFDLTLSMAEDDGRIIGFFEYNTDLFHHETIERMNKHYIQLIQCILNNPSEILDEIDYMDPGEKQTMLYEWNNTSRDYPSGYFIHETITVNALKYPDKLAIYSEKDQVNYASLELLSNQIANFLVQLGAVPEAVIGVCLDRSVSMVVTHLGILKSGAAFVPIDPAYPKERIDFMIRDVKPAIIITENKYASFFNDNAFKLIILERDQERFRSFSTIAPPIPLHPLNRAYVMYTSGSTGKPKGVEICHQGLMNMSNWNVETYGIHPLDRCLQMATPAYDAYVYEIFPCLAAGATAYLVDDISRTSAMQLMHIIFEKQLSVCFLPTALAESIIHENWPLTMPLRILGTAGEKLKSKPHHPLPFHFLNLYGPTENTVIASWHEIKPGEKYEQPPIGRPISNARLYILDAHQNPVPVGITGELYIGGDSVARGYYGRPALTAEKFVPDPFGKDPGKRLYKTGDLVRYLPDGNIDFIGRVDQQVKLRGFRIELEEIEKVLMEHPNISEAAVIINEASTVNFEGFEISNKNLVAYIVSADDQALETLEISQYLKGKLPLFMIPSTYIFIKELPKSFSGKIDKKALPQPTTFVSEPVETELNTTTERKLIAIWKEFLPFEKINIDANFFDMGGHSLMMAQVHYRLKAALGKDISLVDLFHYPTIRSLSDYLESIPSKKNTTASAV